MCNGSQVFNNFFLCHSNTIIFNGNCFCFVIYRDSNRRIFYFTRIIFACRYESSLLRASLPFESNSRKKLLYLSRESGLQVLKFAVHQLKFIFVPYWTPIKILFCLNYDFCSYCIFYKYRNCMLSFGQTIKRDTVKYFKASCKFIDYKHKLTTVNHMQPDSLKLIVQLEIQFLASLWAAMLPSCATNCCGTKILLTEQSYGINSTIFFIEYWNPFIDLLGSDRVYRLEIHLWHS